MPNNTSSSGDIVKEYLLKFPSTSSHKLSMLIFNDVPGLFKDAESARNVIRYYRGSNGKFNRENISNESYIPRIYVPESDDKEYSPYVIEIKSDAFPVMVGSDAHIPYHDQDALEIFIERAIEIKAKTIIMDGDWIDFYQASCWQKDPRNRSTKEELAMFNGILDMMQENTHAKIIFKYGNHEERFDNYLMNNAPQLFELEEMHLDSILRLKERGIDMVKDKRLMKINHLYIIHGHEYKFAISNPVNPARGLYLRAKKNCVCGHFHQTSEHTESAINGDIATDRKSVV
jgi:predicted phosphodiesterase